MKLKSTLPSLVTIVALTVAGCASCPGLDASLPAVSKIEYAHGRSVLEVTFAPRKATSTLEVRSSDGSLKSLRGEYNNQRTCFVTALGEVYERTPKGWKFKGYDF